MKSRCSFLLLPLFLLLVWSVIIKHDQIAAPVRNSKLQRRHQRALPMGLVSVNADADADTLLSRRHLDGNGQLKETHQAPMIPDRQKRALQHPTKTSSSEEEEEDSTTLISHRALLIADDTECSGFLCISDLISGFLNLIFGDDDDDDDDGDDDGQVVVVGDPELIDAPFPEWVCNFQDETFESPSMSTNDTPWVYPKPNLLVGIKLSLFVFPDTDVRIPLTKKKATKEGWVFEPSTCKWRSTDPELSHFELTYLDGSIATVAMENIPLVPTARRNPRYDDWPGRFEMRFTNAQGDAFELSDQTGQVYPEIWEEASNEGWKAGGCSSWMGGFHAYTVPLNQSSFVVPIYDVLGDGLMKAFIALGGLVIPEDEKQTTTRGLDLGGGLGGRLSTQFGCDFNTCDYDGCSEAFAEVTNFSVENDAAINPIHIFFDVDPGNGFSWVSCQRPFLFCESVSCTCCGGGIGGTGESVEEVAFNANCRPSWPPVYD